LPHHPKQSSRHRPQAQQNPPRPAHQTQSAEEPEQPRLPKWPHQLMDPQVFVPQSGPQQQQPAPEPAASAPPLALPKEARIR
jgi:hypothetical protein